MDDWVPGTATESCRIFAVTRRTFIPQGRQPAPRLYLRPVSTTRPRPNHMQSQIRLPEARASSTRRAWPGDFSLATVGPTSVVPARPGPGDYLIAPHLGQDCVSVSVGARLPRVSSVSWMTRFAGNVAHVPRWSPGSAGRSWWPAPASEAVPWFTIFRNHRRPCRERGQQGAGQHPDHVRPGRRESAGIY